MNTWDIKNGDIVFDRGIAIVTGPQKIAQDIENILLNDHGFNRFHPWMGSYLDSYIGNLPEENRFHELKSQVDEALNDYYDGIIYDLQVRTEEFGSMEKAIALADPGSIVVEPPKSEIYLKNDTIIVHVTFKTLYNRKGEVDIDLGVN